MKPHVDLLLFGGAFDPPHLGHTTVAEEVLQANYARQVVLIPVGRHAFDKNLSEGVHRLAMLKLAFADMLKKWNQSEVRLSINSLELDSESISYSYQTALTISRQNPQKSLGFLIGSDNVETFSRWNMSQELRQIAAIFVYPRPGYVDNSIRQAANALGPKVYWLDDVSTVNCSSTSIRDNCRMHTDSSNCLNPRVFEYIKEHVWIQYTNE